MISWPWLTFMLKCHFLTPHRPFSMYFILMFEGWISLYSFCFMQKPSQVYPYHNDIWNVQKCNDQSQKSWELALPSSIGFSPCPFFAEVSPDFLNFSITLCTTDDEILKFYAQLPRTVSLKREVISSHCLPQRDEPPLIVNSESLSLT